MGLVSCLSCFSNSEPRETNSSSNQTNFSRKQPSTSIIEELCHHFSLAEIKSATRNFKETLVIGEGSFGIVYKGYLNKSATAVAIKRNKKLSLWGLSELRNEVVLLCQLRHPNLMPLIGFCIARNELALVYEYMSKGSLYDHLHSRINHEVNPLPWKRRLQICIGVARGLHYLHTGAKYAVIHRNIKSGNIFLDKNWEPKLGGLMLSKRGPRSTSRSLIRVESRVLGTSGYADPQYMATGVLTEKSDVYSFGVVLLEVVSTKKALGLLKIHMNQHNHSLVSNAEKIIDPFLKSKIAPDCWKTFIDITERCLHAHGTERPSMGEVEVELEHALELQEEADAKIDQCNSSG